MCRSIKPFMMKQIEGVVYSNSALVSKQQGSSTTNKPWKIFMQNDAAYQLVGQMNTRPSSVDVESILYNAIAVNNSTSGKENPLKKLFGGGSIKEIFSRFLQTPFPPDVVERTKAKFKEWLKDEEISQSLMRGIERAQRAYGLRQDYEAALVSARIVDRSLHFPSSILGATLCWCPQGFPSLVSRLVRTSGLGVWHLAEPRYSGTRLQCLGPVM